MTDVKKNNEIIDQPVATIDKGFVTLPYTDEEFKEFISGLLGRGQEIERKLSGIFDINVNHLLNIHTLLDQRITQQNRSNLVNFSAKIFFSDDSSVTLHSIEELKTYNEIRTVICRAVHLSWDYLIQFEDKNIPEKQQINVFISASNREFFKFNGNILSSSLASEGLIRISINHTARTWAVDIESLLASYFKNVLETKETAKKIFKRHSNKISFLMALCFFIGIIYISVVTSHHFSTSTISEVSKYLHTNGLSTDDRINYISNFIAEGAWNQFTQQLVLFIVIGTFLSFLLGFILGEILDNFTVGVSFLTIGSASEKYKKDMLAKSKHDWWKLLGTIMVGIISGVLANYVFLYLT